MAGTLHVSRSIETSGAGHRLGGNDDSDQDGFGATLSSGTIDLAGTTNTTRPRAASPHRPLSRTDGSLQLGLALMGLGALLGVGMGCGTTSCTLKGCRSGFELEIVPDCDTECRWADGVRVP